MTDDGTRCGHQPRKAPRGRLSRALTFKLANGMISEIQVIGDATRLGELDVSIVD